jgi:DNA-binding response OmpR family regulator
LPAEEGTRLPLRIPPVHLLIVDDDDHIGEVCRVIAEDRGMKVYDASTAEKALEVLELTPVDILLTDLGCRGPADWSCAIE